MPALITCKKEQSSERARYGSRLNAMKPLTVDEPTRAGFIVLALLGRWIELDYPGLEGITFQKHWLRYSAIDEMLNFIRSLPFERGAYYLSVTYSKLVKHEERKAAGMFFTPPEVAHRLISTCEKLGVDLGAVRVVDPACGGSALLLPAAVRINQLLARRGIKARDRITHLQTHISGGDIDDVLRRLSGHFLQMALYAETRESGMLPEFSLRRHDSLASESSAFMDCDLVLCNPPFRKVTAQEKNKVPEVYRHWMKGQANLYGYFMALCMDMLKLGGMAAMITPSGFLSGHSFTPLRKGLVSHNTVRNIALSPKRAALFIDVQQEVAITHVVKGRRSGRRPQVKVETLCRATRTEVLNKVQLPDDGQIWAIPRNADDALILEQAARCPATLADYGYRARVGHHVWNRDEHRRPQYTSAEDALAAGASVVPLIWADQIAPMRPFKPSWGNAPEYVQMVLDCSGDKMDQCTRRPAVLIQRVTNNNQKMRIVAAPMNRDFISRWKGFAAENHVVILEQVSENPALNPSQLAELLSTNWINRQLSCLSASANISVFELGHLRLPNPDILHDAINAKSSVSQALKRTVAA
ncbi:N-6 DNA methylase [Chromohalobacter sp.]|uniref:HsdM family class I SAM-dependent methyltransferase n=1 Tax=Chromohalobacter sp. TaxID=50740 RepID=UPI003242E4F2